MGRDKFVHLLNITLMISEHTKGEAHIISAISSNIFEYTKGEILFVISFLVQRTITLLLTRNVM